MKKEITDKLYAAYGTDSGILLGITERAIVEVIVQFTINEMTKPKRIRKTQKLTLSKPSSIY